MQQDDNKNRRRLGLFITLIINIVIVGYIAIREFNTGEEVKLISFTDINFIYLLIGIGCFGAAVLMDYLKYRRMLMTTEGRLDRKGSIEVALLGKYYDNVTPFGAGGQPFQIHYLRKRGYSTGTSAAAPAMGFLTQQIAFVICGAVVFISNREVLQFLPVLNITAYVGLLMYAILPVALLLLALFPSPFKAAVRGFYTLCGKLHIVKDVDAKCAKAFAGLDEYKQCIALFAKHPIVFVKLMLLSLGYQLAILSIPFFMLRAFGGGDNWWTVFSLVVYIYAAITIIPTPGNAGAAEGSFYAVFSSLEGSMLFWAMIAWRILVYYSWLICGIIVIARSGSRNRPRYKLPPQEGPLNVGLFVDIYYPAVDGVVHTVDAYARSLTSAGHNACVICPRQPKQTSDEGLGYPVYRLGSFRFPGLAFAVPIGRATREIKQAFAENPPDVIHAHSPFFSGRLALRFGRKYKAPVVATFHSKFYDDALNVTHSRILSKLMVDIVVNFFNKADIVWACSRSAADTLRSYGYNGEIFVMENGINAEEIPAEPELEAQRAVEAFSLPEGKRTLLYVGQLIWHKNIRLILDTLKLLLENDDRYHLVLVGAGYNGDEIHDYSRKLGIDVHVTFTDKVLDRSLLYGLYKYSDLLFFPSYYDTSGLVIREAAAVGTPSLLAEDADAADVIKDDENGFAAAASPEAMAERIRRAYDSSSIERVGLAAKQTIPVSWSDIIARAVTAYRTLSYEGHEYKLNKLFGDAEAPEQ